VSFGMDDVYFMTRISRRGEVVNLQGGSNIEGELSIQEYIDVYCDKGTEKVTSQIHVAWI